MFARITLTPTKGPVPVHTLLVADRGQYTVGRSAECLVQVSGGDAHLTISRRHCMLDVDPPLVRVRDLGSLNGTYVNGQRIGWREKGTRPAEPSPASPAPVELHDGDRIGVGDVEFVVAIEDSPPEGELYACLADPVAP